MSHEHTRDEMAKDITQKLMLLPLPVLACALLKATVKCDYTIARILLFVLDARIKELDK